MASVFGIPCSPPPSFREVYGDTPLFPLSDFVRSMVQHPDTKKSKHARFFDSKLFMTFYLWYVVFRIPRELSHFLNASIGLNFGVLLILNIVFVFELFRRYGYECTIFLVTILYLVYNGLVALIPVAAASPIGDALPELKEIPASTRKPGLNHCRRLAICRATPVYDNHRFQRGKHEKCLECAKQNERIIFDESKEDCGSKKRDVDAKRCYECTVNTEPDTGDCTYDSAECQNVTMILDILDPPTTEPRFMNPGAKDDPRVELIDNPDWQAPRFDRAAQCKEARGSLCWLGKLSEGRYRGWNYRVTSDGASPLTFALDDPAARGQGFPTQEVCEHVMRTMGSGPPAPECVRAECDVSDKEAACACAQYKDVAQFDDPCAFLEANCDENSVAYKEAQLKMKQANVDVSDIVSVGDAKKLLSDLDKISNTIP